MIIIQSPVKLSPKAAGEIKKMLDTGKIPADHGLRIGARETGSGAVSHILGFDMKNVDDNEYVFDAIRVLINKHEVVHLAGMTVDYYDGPEARGFIFMI
jgi:iron-sulfur cluster assembly protein